MNLNDDFTRRVAAHSAELPWRASPVAGVERRMLDRIGGEVARATSIVRFAPGSDFSPHTHHGGEEFIVLDGVFQDESGYFPAGSYIRNPPGTSHKPSSVPGCTIFVKLWQFDPDDRLSLTCDMAAMPARPDPDRPGIRAALLHGDDRETVRLEIWEPGTAVNLDPSGGAEILVLDGGFLDGDEAFTRHDWLRLPDGHRTVLRAGPEGAKVWIKTGHLRNVRAPAAS